MVLQHVPLRLMQPRDHDQFMTDFNSEERLRKSRLDLEPRIRRPFRSLPRRVFTPFHGRTDETNRLERIGVHSRMVLHSSSDATVRSTLRIGDDKVPNVGPKPQATPP